MLAVVPLILSLSAHNIDSYGVTNYVPPTDVIYIISETTTITSLSQTIVGSLPTMSEVIQSAKQAATSLSSPPRIYATSGNSVSLWPDQPGTVETSYGTRGVQPPPRQVSFASGAAMTLNTLVEPIDDGYSVTFQSAWVEAGASRSHSWTFRVDANHQATFVGEDGDALPPLRM